MFFTIYYLFGDFTMNDDKRKKKQLFREEEVKEVRPYRFQYSMKEAAYMLSTSESTAKKWCKDYLYKMNGEGHNFIKHDDLVAVVDQKASFESFLNKGYGGTERG
tara:strand:+ start:35 stop:349 length:315 start_codon:yes stop_codon:yes gene_type:complete